MFFQIDEIKDEIRNARYPPVILFTAASAESAGAEGGLKTYSKLTEISWLCPHHPKNAPLGVVRSCHLTASTARSPHMALSATAQRDSATAQRHNTAALSATAQRHNTADQHHRPAPPISAQRYTLPLSASAWQTLA